MLVCSVLSVVDFLLRPILGAAAVFYVLRHPLLAGLGFLHSVFGASVVGSLEGLTAFHVTVAVLDIVEAFFLFPLLGGLIGATAKARAFAGAVEAITALPCAIDMTGWPIRLFPAMSAVELHLSSPSGAVRVGRLVGPIMLELNSKSTDV